MSGYEHSRVGSAEQPKMSGHKCPDEDPRVLFRQSPHIPESVRRFVDETHRASVASSPYAKDEDGHEIELSWEKSVSVALGAKDHEMNTVPMPPTRMRKGPLDRLVRIVRLEASVCLAKHGKSGLRIPYQDVFGEASVCREHPSELSMLAIVLTRWQPEANVPHMPLQLVVESASHAECCGGTDTPREWTNPRHARVAFVTRDAGGKDLVSTATCRRLIGEDRLPLSLFEATQSQSTEAHISEQTALASGIQRPFTAAGGVYQIPVPIKINTGSMDKRRHRAFVTDYVATRLCVSNPTMIAPKAASLTLVDGHITVSTAALQTLNDHFRRKHREEKSCTVVPTSDIVIRVVPSHAGGEMESYIEANANARRSLFVSIGLEFWVAVGGEPKYSPKKDAADPLESLLDDD